MESLESHVKFLWQWRVRQRDSGVFRHQETRSPALGEAGSEDRVGDAESTGVKPDLEKLGPATRIGIGHTI